MNYARTKLHVKNIAIVHDANFYGTNGAQIAAAQAKTFGMNVLDEESYAGDATDFTAQLLKVKNVKPDAIVLWGATATPGLVVRQARSLGLTMPIFGTSGILSPAFINVAGDGAKDVYATSNLDPGNPNAEQRKLADLYDKAYHAPLVAFAAMAWDAAHIIVAALGNAGTNPTGNSLSGWLTSGKQIVGVQGNFRFSATDHNGLIPADVHVLTVRDGHWMNP